MRDQVFISYSHKDKEWLERLQTVLKPLIRKGVVNVWDDTRIETGQKWREEIKSALATAKVAVLLVSPDFLASNFVVEDEMPVFLKAAADDGLKIVWVPVRDCLYTETEIYDYQAAFDPARPLAGLSQAEVDKALVEISKKIKAATVEKTDPPKPATPPILPKADKPAPRPPAARTPAVEEDQPPHRTPDAPVTHGLSLHTLLPGTWQINIQTLFPGAAAQMRMEAYPNGLFRAGLITPMGMTTVEGQWMVDQAFNRITLQGGQSNGFQTLPYVAVVQVSHFDATSIIGTSMTGEQVTWQKLQPFH